MDSIMIQEVLKVWSDTLEEFVEADIVLKSSQYIRDSIWAKLDAQRELIESAMHCNTDWSYYDGSDGEIYVRSSIIFPDGVTYTYDTGLQKMLTYTWEQG